MSREGPGLLIDGRKVSLYMPLTRWLAVKLWAVVLVVVVNVVAYGVGGLRLARRMELPVGVDVDLPDGATRLRVPAHFRATERDGGLTFRSAGRERFGFSSLRVTPAPGACPSSTLGARWAWHGARLWIEQRIETMGMKDRIFDVVIPTQAGGGAERLYRAFTSIWRNYLNTDFEVDFFPGASGRAGYETYINNRERDPHNLLFGALIILAMNLRPSGLFRWSRRA